MAWTTPRTWVAGETVTAAIMNTHVRDNLKALGDPWTAYTPTWTASTTNPTLGNGTLTGRAVQVGKFTQIRIAMVGGTTTAVGSGSYSFALPAASISSSEQTLAADFFDGANHYAAVGLIASGASVVNVFSTKGGTSGSVIVLDSSSFSAGAAAIIACEGTYEAA